MFAQAADMLEKYLVGQPLPLLSWDQVPGEAREVAILQGYRPPKCSAQQCMRSIFQLTNETLNVWSHLLPALFFWWRLGVLADDLAIPEDPYTWPFAAYLVSVCLYLLASAMAHTFFSISDLSRHVCFFFDYAALSLYGFGVALMYRAYVIPEIMLGTWLADVFVPICAVLAILCTLLACYSRFLSKSGWVTVYRLGAFTLPWAWDSIPLVYRLMTEEHFAAASYYKWQFVFSALIGAFYASHLPERLAPGVFDVIGHSHQMLHISGVLASYTQYHGALLDLTSRRNIMEPHSLPPPLHTFALVLLSNIIIVAFFSWRASSECTTDRSVRSHPPQCTTSRADRQIVRMAVTDCCHITNRSTAHSVLEPVVLPYLQGLYTAIFQQDNARPHVARIVQRFFDNRQIELPSWPARSPELSPIENMWSMVAQRLTQITSPAATPDQLWQRVEAAWSAVAQEHIQSIFESMPRRVAAVISNNRGYSGY
ncbi:PAQR5 [Cordylochernes scorpioides]|uniref:PAQR5 n=1 Tax=Cordylochernes scorpioides TaxID=51811 RepID=A0ABY6JVK7_9ARAC|nr:PAQR5 [Cordylochernes scorpioides]